jgi:hypothetical protein
VGRGGFEPPLFTAWVPGLQPGCFNRSHHLPKITYNLAGPERFELPVTVLETVGLPLTDSPTMITSDVSVAPALTGTISATRARPRNLHMPR